MKRYLVVMTIILSLTTVVLAANEAIPSMPKIKEKTFVVKDGEALESQRGFGDQEPTVRMMNLMMVEGSGMEGMEMAQAEHSEHSTAGANQKAQENTSDEFPYEIEVKKLSELKVGTNIIEFNIKEKQKASKGLKLKAQVYMTSMDMGTEEPKVKELSPGKYQVKAPFAMLGPWAIKLIFPNGKEKVFNFEVKSK